MSHRSVGAGRVPSSPAGSSHCVGRALLWLLALLMASSPGCTCGADERAGDAADADGADHQRATADEGSCPPGTQPSDGPVRPAALAGSWYPANEAALAAALEGYLAAVPGAADAGRADPPIALISPHAGYRFSGSVAAHGYRALRGRSYDRVFLVGPAHRAAIEGISLPNAAYYRTPLGPVPVDRGIVQRLLERPPFVERPAAHEQEHGLEIQLPFLQQVLEGPFAIVPMLVGRLDAGRTRAAIEALRREVAPGDLIIASSDFTHYGPSYRYVPFRDDVPAELARYVEQAFSFIEQRDAAGFLERKERTGDTICGAWPIALLLELLPSGVEAHKLAFDTSGRVTGDYENSVSYLSVAFTGAAWPGTRADRLPPGCVAATNTGLAPRSKQTLRAIARRSLERWVRSRERFDPDDSDLAIDDELREPLGVFVTLEKHEALRGCIGNILPRAPLYRAVADRAIDASQDGRFTPVRPDELDDIEIEISVLTRPRPVRGPGQIVIGRHGIILDRQGRRAVFLPQVAPEQGWSREETLDHLSRKAGLAADAWRDGARFEVFEALVF